jgi:hypothetical protein
MKVFLCKKDMYILVVNNSIIYVFDKEEATDFADVTVENFVKLKESMEEREGEEFNLEFIHS